MPGPGEMRVGAFGPDKGSGWGVESISQARGTNWPLAKFSKLDQESIKEKKKKLYYALDLVSYTHALVLFCHLLVSIDSFS